MVSVDTGGPAPESATISVPPAGLVSPAASVPAAASVSPAGLVQPTGHVPPLGRHVLADLHGVAPALLRDPHGLGELLAGAARAAGARVLGTHFHHFGGGAGVTGVVLLSESHITIHTWPEHGYAALDIFMCGHANPELALEHVRLALAPARAGTTTVPRGAARAPA
ncbi:adenosylmethionine decarboxylase [Bordetella genomosp. 10]|uniref:S-adenosylmethionine decarboxylase proenzyme n=1 Tax=Bordetella genomosp. 10 TaxID=1416804 RepID=A0A261S5W6_9BORD|nr:adenosylmethionine decarboxylase [Bordetella genomosp. 10]